MGSLIHRTILQYIETNDLPGLKLYLDARRHTSIIDDRDEVYTDLTNNFRVLHNCLIHLEWCHCSYRRRK